jgi:pyruvate dehydrogenase E2 component (dihydrolipoamide acetyltransferase)
MAVEIVMPRLSDSMEEGVIVRWLVAEGDHIEPGQPLAEIETDKATVTYEADDAGVVVALSAEEGATVPVGAPIAMLGERLSASPAAEVSVQAGTASGPAETGRTKASPLARRLAAELNVDLSAVAGSGPHGRVIRTDVERAAAAANGDRSPAPPRPERPSSRERPSSHQQPSSAKGESSVHELTRLQQTVARRMSESRATVPDIELRVEVEMSEAVALRERLREVADPVPSINDLIVRAVALALAEFPRVNGAYRDATLETYSRVNVGIAVAGEDALVVPTIFDADKQSLAEVARSSRALAARVRDGSITPSELSGGTFTVSNLGMHGVDSFSAVINPPQAAILTVGSLKRRPIVDEASAEVVARPTVVLSLACDHRILYGVDGARFLTRVRELLERPLALLL